MKARELIKILEKIDPETVVTVVGAEDAVGAIALAVELAQLHDLRSYPGGMYRNPHPDFQGKTEEVLVLG